jgi:hypothetical protein
MVDPGFGCADKVLKYREPGNTGFPFWQILTTIIVLRDGHGVFLVHYIMNGL